MYVPICKDWWIVISTSAREQTWSRPNLSLPIGSGPKALDLMKLSQIKLTDPNPANLPPQWKALQTFLLFYEIGRNQKRMSLIKKTDHNKIEKHVNSNLA